MTLLTELKTEAGEREFTTYISSDLQRLYERALLAEQKQTATSLSEYPQEAGFTREEALSRIMAIPRLHEPDWAIIRFYEGIIAELQRELATYRQLVWELFLHREAEPEDYYTRGEVVRLPGDLAKKLRVRTRPGLPVEGHEI